jgi:cation diffusion facilitator family transporter
LEDHAYSSEAREAQVGAWSSALVNIILAVGKGTIGLLFGSRALFADAIHSAADLLGSFAVMIGLKIARKPPDAEHPYGHGRAELISSTIVAGLLMAAAVEVAVNSIHSFWSMPEDPHVVSAAAAIASIVIKEFMYQYNYQLGKRLQSKSLLASAVDHRSDVFSSIAALIGILLSLIGKHLGIHWLLYMDAVAGAFVALLVFKMGYGIAVDAVQVLMDRVVTDDELAPYAHFISGIPGVRRIDELRARDHGRYVIVDVEISVDAEISVAAGHVIAAAVKHAMEQEFRRVEDVLVHVNPFYSDEREESELD